MKKPVWGDSKKAQKKGGQTWFAVGGAGDGTTFAASTGRER